MRTLSLTLLLIVALGRFAAPCALAQEAANAAPALWTGPHSLGVRPGTLRQHPGEHPRGDVLFEMELAYIRTGRLAVEYVAPLRSGAFRVPAGAPVFATQFQTISLTSGSPHTPRESREPKPAPGSNHWCALPEPDGFVCFFWSASGQVFYNPRHVGGSKIDERAPFLAFEPGPAPQIAEQPVEIGRPRHLQYSLTDFDEEGFVLSGARRQGDEQGRTFALPRAPWGEYRGAGYSDGVVMQVTPVRGADGGIRAARVSFAPPAAR